MNHLLYFKSVTTYCTVHSLYCCAFSDYIISHIDIISNDLLTGWIITAMIINILLTTMISYDMFNVIITDAWSELSNDQ